MNISKTTMKRSYVNIIHDGHDTVLNIKSIASMSLDQTQDKLRIGMNNGEQLIFQGKEQEAWDVYYDIKDRFLVSGLTKWLGAVTQKIQELFSIFKINNRRLI